MLRLAALFAAASSLVACSAGVPARSTATVLSVDGLCTVSRPANDPGRPLTTSIHPGAGNVISTGNNGRVVAALLPNLVAEEMPNTKIQLIELSLIKDGNETGADAMRRRIARLKLLNGGIRIAHERRDVAAEPLLTVETPHGVAQSSFDCVFEISTNDRQTRLLCSSGWVEFSTQRSGNATRVEPGYVLEIEPNTAPKTMAAESEIWSQKAIGALTSTAQSMMKLRDSLREAAPPWKVASGR